MIESDIEKKIIDKLKKMIECKEYGYLQINLREGEVEVIHTHKTEKV